MATESPFCTAKAHRVSRHVSFQAVVPPSVAFPVNYSGPSLLQVSNHINAPHQSTPDVKISEKVEHLPTDLKEQHSHQISTVFTLNYDGKLQEAPEKTTCDKLRSKFAILSTSKKRCCYLESFRFSRKNLAFFKRRCFIVVSTVAALLVCILIIVSLIAPGRKRLAEQMTGICESTGCLRIGLFFQTALSNINRQGVWNVCSKPLHLNFVKMIWVENKGIDVCFQSPFKLAVEEMLLRISANYSRLKNCISSTEENLISGFSTNSTAKLSQVIFPAEQHGSRGYSISIAQMLHESTLTFNTIDDVLRLMHVKYRISLFFEIWTDKETAEISPLKEHQPWDNFNLKNDHSRFANELRKYICISLRYAQSVGVPFRMNSSINCTTYDDEHIKAVYEILAQLQEIKMVEELRRMQPSDSECTNFTVTELNALTKNTVDILGYLRHCSGGNIVSVCGPDAIKWITGILRQTRSSDLQDYIFFSIVNKYGPRSSGVVADAKHRLMNLAYGNIGQLNHAYCIFETALPQLKGEFYDSRASEIESFYQYANKLVLKPIKNTYENYFQGTCSIKKLISKMAISRIWNRKQDISVKILKGKSLKTPASWMASRKNRKESDIYRMCGFFNDIGLSTFGSKMLRHIQNKNGLEPSILLLYDKRIDFLDEKPRCATFAILGYWISLAIADAIFKTGDGFGPGEFPDPIKPLYECVLSAFEIKQQRDYHVSATEYMRRLRIMKISLAMEMLTRAYIESKKSTTCPRIPGIQLPEDQIFFILLIKSVCTKPIYSDLGLPETCETALLAAEMSPTFMSLVGCHSNRTVSLSLTNNSTAPSHFIPAKCFK